MTKDKVLWVRIKHEWLIAKCQHVVCNGHTKWGSSVQVLFRVHVPSVYLYSPLFCLPHKGFSHRLINTSIGFCSGNCWTLAVGHRSSFVTITETEGNKGKYTWMHSGKLIVMTKTSEVWWLNASWKLNLYTGSIWLLDSVRVEAFEFALLCSFKLDEKDQCAGLHKQPSLPLHIWVFQSLKNFTEQEWLNTFCRKPLTTHRN